MTSPKFLAVALAALAIAVSQTPAVAYDTINCRSDRSPAERTICADQRLQVLDAKVAEAYTDIMLDRRIKADIKRAVHDSQINFLQRRERCGRDAECLAEVMSLRATRINYYR